MYNYYQTIYQTKLLFSLSKIESFKNEDHYINDPEVFNSNFRYNGIRIL